MIDAPFAPVEAAVAVGRIPGAALGLVTADGQSEVRFAGMAALVPEPEPHVHDLPGPAVGEAALKAVEAEHPLTNPRAMRLDLVSPGQQVRRRDPVGHGEFVAAGTGSIGEVADRREEQRQVSQHRRLVEHAVDGHAVGVARPRPAVEHSVARQLNGEPLDERLFVGDGAPWELEDDVLTDHSHPGQLGDRRDGVNVAARQPERYAALWGRSGRP